MKVTAGKLIAMGLLWLFLGFVIMPAVHAIHVRFTNALSGWMFVVGGFAMIALGIVQACGLSLADVVLPTWEDFKASGQFSTTLQLAVLASITIAFAAAAEWLDLFVIRMRSQNESPFFHRLRESIFVWTVGFSLAGWLCCFRRFKFRYSSQAWTMILLPFLMAVVVAIRMLQVDWANQRTDASQVTAFSLLQPAHMLAMGLVSSGILLVQFSSWIRLSQRWHCRDCGYFIGESALEICPECGRVSATVVPCNTCGFDLTGNESGVCPECGGKVAVVRRDTSRYEGRLS